MNRRTDIPEGVITGWHFCAADRRLGYGDGREIRAGETLSVTTKPELCKSGLHASERAIDALKYASGPVVSRVWVGGGLVRGEDKVCGMSRHTLWIADAENTLRAFARWYAAARDAAWATARTSLDATLAADLSRYNDKLTEMLRELAP